MVRSLLVRKEFLNAKEPLSLLGFLLHVGDLDASRGRGQWWNSPQLRSG